MIIHAEYCTLKSTSKKVLYNVEYFGRNFDVPVMLLNSPTDNLKVKIEKGSQSDFNGLLKSLNRKRFSK